MFQNIKIDNIIKLAYLDGMGGSALRQQVDTMNVALQNIMLQFAIDDREYMNVQSVLSGTYQDWVNAIGPDNLLNATTALWNSLGYGTIENMISVPQSSPMDLSWVGSLFNQNR